MPLIRNKAMKVIHSLYEQKLVDQGNTTMKARVILEERAAIHKRLYESEDKLITFNDDSADHRRLAELNKMIFGEEY